MVEYETQDWFDRGDIDAYHAYWNDESVERGKPFWVEEDSPGSFAAMEAYLSEAGLFAQLDACAEVLTERPPARGKCVDLASGNAWAVPRLLALPYVERVYAVEYSRPRLLTLAPRVLTHYRVTRDQAVLCAGSFYDVRLPPETVSLVFMSQALHHADRPDELLAQTRRILRRDGAVIILGEHVIGSAFLVHARHIARWAVARLVPSRVQRRVLRRVLNVPQGPLARTRELLAPDPVLGDHYYTTGEYRAMFERAGFEARTVPAGGGGTQGFVLWRRD